MSKQDLAEVIISTRVILRELEQRVCEEGVWRPIGQAGETDGRQDSLTGSFEPGPNPRVRGCVAAERWDMAASI